MTEFRPNSSVVVTAETASGDYYGRVGRVVTSHRSHVFPDKDVVYVSFPEYTATEATLFYSSEVAPEAVAGPYAVHAGSVLGGEGG